jgi:hypothetical protein
LTASCFLRPRKVFWLFWMICPKIWPSGNSVYKIKHFTNLPLKQRTLITTSKLCKNCLEFASNCWDLDYGIENFSGSNSFPRAKKIQNSKLHS